MITAEYCTRWLMKYQGTPILSDEGHKAVYTDGHFSILLPTAHRWHVMADMDWFSVFVWAKCTLTEEEEKELYCGHSTRELERNKRT